MTELKLGAHRQYIPDQELMFLAGEPMVYHCHHFNLFLDQTIDDALGAAEGTLLRTEAAAEFAHRLLTSLCSKMAADTPPERLQLCQELFRQLGQGTLEINADAEGGRAIGTHLHYSFAWQEKYGKKVKRHHAADAFAAGFAAASVEVAFGLPPGSMTAKEEQCFALRDKSCVFALRRRIPPVMEGASVDAEVTKAIVGPPEDGIGEDVIQPIAQGLKDFTSAVAGDQRGLVQAFGVFVTMQLTGYYNRVSYDAVRRIEAKSPHSVEVLEELLRESGHVCVFNTFGGILLSPEWEGLVGPLTNNPLDILKWSIAIGRALGMGRWVIAEFEADRRFVVRTSSSYESVYYRARHGLADRPVEYLFQGAAIAMAQLAHRVKFTEKPALTPEYYQSLFKGGVPWHAEQTRSIVCGDSCSEIVVTKK
jgi:hypothetical protein